LGDKAVIVQGFGNVGYYAAKFIQEGGATITGIIEWDGAVYNPDGIDVIALKAHHAQTGSIRNFAGAQTIDAGNTVLEYPCDILVPAALESQITDWNADRIQAKIIAEGANGPIAASAEPTLLAKNILVIPDMFINAGGVVVSYFEWLKNLSHVRFGRLDKRYEENSKKGLIATIENLTGKSLSASERSLLVQGPNEVDLVNSGLEDSMIGSYHEIMEVWRNKANVKDMRTAAFISAIDKIAASYNQMGIFP
jgi:glutamate dehydrogenase (NAD(P)+)